VKVTVTFDFDKGTREAIGHLTGEGVADYKACKLWIQRTVYADLAAIIQDEKENNEADKT
jgi:hypothetical protein